MAVFSFYELESNDLSAILAFIRDRMVEKSWELISDDIATTNSFVVRVPNTGNYYKIAYHQEYGLTVFYKMDYDGTVELDTTTSDLFENRSGSSGFYFLFSGVKLFLNSEFCVIFREGYFMYNSVIYDTVKLVLPLIFGKVQSNDSIYSSYYKGIYGAYRIWDYYYEQNYDIYYEYWGSCYNGNLFIGGSRTDGSPYIKDSVGTSSSAPVISYNYLENSKETSSYIYVDDKETPQFWAMPKTAGKYTLVSVPIFAQTTDGSNTYYFPFAETPFYYTFYYGKDDYKRIITLNTSKYMIMPYCLHDGTNSGSSAYYPCYGLAFECDNI